MATAGQVRRPASSTDRLSGTPSASIAATGAVVVSKPAAKNTTRRSGFSACDAHRFERRGDRHDLAARGARLLERCVPRLCEH